MAQKNWDKFETALLIEAYQRIKQGEVDKNSALVALSQNLREMAKNDGYVIDDTFRNLNGMQWQLGYIEKAFSGEDYESRTPSLIFGKMVAVYNKNPELFRVILKEAHQKIEGKIGISGNDRKQLFLKWLSNHSNALPMTIVDNITYVSSYANKHGLSTISFWNFCDYKKFNTVRVKISGSKLFRFMHAKEHRLFEKSGKLYAIFLKSEQEKLQSSKIAYVDEGQVDLKHDTNFVDSVEEKKNINEQNIKTNVAEVVECEGDTYNFNSPQNLAYTKPVYVSYGNQVIDNISTWRELYISLCGIILLERRADIASLYGKSLIGAVRPDFGDFELSSQMVAPVKIIDNLYLEVNLSATDIMKRLSLLLTWAQVPYDKLVVRYVSKGEKANNDQYVCEVKEFDATQNEPQSIVNTPILADTDAFEQYYLWLIQERKLTNHTSRSYTSNLRFVNTYAQECGLIEASLFDMDDNCLQNGIGAILTNEEFAKYNVEQHNRFSAALQAYSLFRLGEKSSDTKIRRSRRHQIETIICPEELKSLLIKKFPYGIRIDSAIDMMKLKNFADMFEVVLPESEELLKSQISTTGISYDGKIYFVSDEISDTIIEKINNIFDDGYNVIYYEELFAKDTEWFEENHISSWELIREILNKYNEDLFISKNFLRRGIGRVNEADAVEEEFENVWGDCVVHTYDEMYELLPYIPNYKIRRYISKSDKFVWSTNETFASINKVVISEQEAQEIVEYVTNECELVGHASISNVPLGNIEEENYQISINAIYDAIYTLILKDDFFINGKILTRNNNDVDALTLTKRYCATKDMCSISELNDYVISINGTLNRQLSLRAAYDQMIRIEEDKLVADRFVNFDVDMIDVLLEQAIGEFASIKSIATFVMFPNCNFAWNHYVLESFCYRFSKKFRLEIINFNDKNAGIIAKKEVDLSYADMLAVIAADSGLSLTAETIGQYLYDNGYTTRRKMPTVDYAVEKAKKVRERK